MSHAISCLFRSITFSDDLQGGVAVVVRAFARVMGSSPGVFNPHPGGADEAPTAAHLRYLRGLAAATGTTGLGLGALD